MRLVILYDAACAVCVRCRELIEAQDALVPIRFVACRSPRAKARYGTIPLLVHELVVVDDDSGNWWAGSAAFVMTLWALAPTRGLAELACASWLAPITHALFSWITAHRTSLAWLAGTASCDNGACEVHGVVHAQPSMYR
jgi:predicted DCC family thiol-disulfide oxidoreductase YuxK